MITLVNEYSAVLDASVLLPIKLCDLLLRLAEEPALYSPRWSADILGEVARNLTQGKFKVPEQKARYRVECMKSAFPEAMVSGYDVFIDAMPIHEKDRHVLACAVMANADCIITANLKHFRKDQILQFGIEPIHPDDFLVNQWTLSEQSVKNKLYSQARNFDRHILTHLGDLERSIPKFASMARAGL